LARRPADPVPSAERLARDAARRAERDDDGAAHGAVVAERVERVRVEAQVLGITTDWSRTAAAGPAVLVQARGEAIGIAIGNLLATALRYTPRGGRVRVGVAARGCNAIVVVEDSGPGVAADEAARIFEAFARGRAGRSADEREPIRGLGLGLSSARRIAEHYGGDLELGTGSLGGAAFVIGLPVFSDDSSPRG